MARMPFRSRGPVVPLRGISHFIAGFITLLGVTAAAGDYAELLRRGEAARDAGDFRSAVAIFREAIDREPKNAAAYSEAAETCVEAYVRLKLSCDVRGRSIWLAPRDWSPHAKPPYRFSLTGELDAPTEQAYDDTVPVEIISAHDFATRATELAPSDASGWHWLGRACAVIGENEAALASLERATELDPSDASVWYGYGAVHAIQGDHSSALRRFDVAARLAPSHVIYRSDRGLIRRSSGDRESAADFLAAGFTPESVEIICGADGDRGRAGSGHWYLAYATEMIRLQPDQLHWRHIRSDAAMRAREYQTVLEDADFALSLTPRTARFLDWRWAALYHLGRYEEALETVERGRQIRPYSPDFDLAQALVLGALGRSDEARRARRRGEWLIR